MKAIFRVISITIILTIFMTIIGYGIFPLPNISITQFAGASAFLSLLILLKDITRRFQRKSEIVVVCLLCLILPVILVYTVQRFIATSICMFPTRISVRDVTGVADGAELTICGYLRDCVWGQVGSQRHTWEICTIDDPLADQTVLLYNYDITESDKSTTLDFLKSLRYYSSGTLLTIPTKRWREFFASNCPINHFCDTKNIIAELSNYPIE